MVRIFSFCVRAPLASDRTCRGREALELKMLTLPFLPQSPCPSPSGSERAATATPLDTASNAEDTSSNGNKDDEDDDADDDNDDDKIDAQYDPERLKAFNVSARRVVGPQ